MRTRIQSVLGGPVGRLRFDMVELDPVDGPFPQGLRELGPADLPDAERAGLLAVGPDHRARLERGELVLVAVDGSGELEGLVWLNHVGHDDRYGGRWSAPGAGAVYLNQLMVHPGSRGRGVGRRLLRGCRIAAADRGWTSIRSLVQPGNAASHAVFAAEGAVVRHRLLGLRLGRWSLRVRLPPAATSR